MSIELTRTAEKQLRRIAKRVPRRVIESIESLSERPRPRDPRKLRGYDEICVRLGQYRIVYEVYEDRAVIIVLKVGHRKDVYREGAAFFGRASDWATAKALSPG